MNPLAPPRAAIPLLVLGALTLHAEQISVTGGTSLTRFNTGNTRLAAAVPITGLQPNETLVDIDLRPIDSRVYGIGSTSRMYIVNAQTGAATQAARRGRSR